MIELRHANDRGRADFGWLKSAHTFSFGSYYDPKHMGFSALRVINDDKVAPSAGFDTHGHKDMEIISFVTHGVIEHKDSMGHVQSLPKGEFQLMSAGKGVLHSEYNGSDKDELRFLQIWIEPNEKGGAPGYQQKEFGRKQGITPIISPDGRNNTLKIKQDALLNQLVLAPETSEQYSVYSSRNLYIHVVDGTLNLTATNEKEPSVIANQGDGIKISDIEQVKFNNNSGQEVTALIFDLP